MEWERLALSNPESVPGRSGLRTRRFTAETLTVRKLTLPQQNNSSDCGCFLLTYLEVRARLRGCLLRHVLTRQFSIAAFPEVHAGLPEL